MAKKKRKQVREDILNRKLRFKYHVEETVEAGMVLKGTEVKAIRGGNAQINEAYCKFKGDELFLYQAHISEYTFGNFNNHEPGRERKLLLHKKEMHRLRSLMEAGGKALVPSRIYFKKGLIKIELALCTGKKLYDKREDLKKRVALREAERAVKAFR